jgi:transcriptional regulator with XRE-family HTH domain
MSQPARDIHPDDLAARLTMLATLGEVRQRKGWSQYELSKRLRLNSSRVRQFETSTTGNFTVSILCRYGAPLGIGPALTFVGLEPVPAPYADQLDAMGYPAAAVLHRMVVTRRAHGIHIRDIAERGGWKRCTLENEECNLRWTAVAPLQVYARALTPDLSSRLDLSWELL